MNCINESINVIYFLYFMLLISGLVRVFVDLEGIDCFDDILFDGWWLWLEIIFIVFFENNV